MYEQRFGLNGSPFRLNPDPKFFFGSRSHNKAMAYLHYGLRQGEGFIVITGEIGAGKSILIGHLLDQLDRTNVVAAHLVTASLEPSALLAHVLSAFRIAPAGEGKTAEIEALEDFLYDQMNRGRRVLLIVDEAQNLPVKTIEELRMLSNMDYEGTPLFQVFLVGQPEFRALIASAEMEQLRQRVIASYHLDPLDTEETRAYILHRLHLVGWADKPAFADEAFAAIHAATGGVPRKINTLCNRLFLFCALEGKASISAALVRAVQSELSEEMRREPFAETAITPSAARAPRAAAPIGAPAVAAPSNASTVTKSGGSVFDRLKAVRLGDAAPQSPVLVSSPAPEPEAEEAEAPPAAATLSDVAEAIAQAAPLASPEAMDVPAPEPAASISPPENDPAEIVEGAALTPFGETHSVAPKDWRQAVMRSIDETREELRSAHANVMRLRKQHSEINRRRHDRRQKVAANLARAESLLAEIRNVWR